LLTADRRRTAYRRLRRHAVENPQTFTEKLVHKMAHDRRPLLRTFADKVAARDFVSDRVGSDVLPNLYGVYNRAERIDWEGLPREFVLKATHGSGAVAVVWEGASRGCRPTADNLPSWTWRDQIHPDDLDRTQLARLAHGWMGMDYELLTSRPEWAYSELPRRVLAEEVLTDAEGLLPSDYKLYMMHGRCTLIDVHLGRFGEHSGELRSPEWELLPGNFVLRKAPARDTPAPANLMRMIQIGEALSRDVDFVRVDLYDLGDRVVFGELTNYPAAAAGQYSPGLDMLLGQGWNPPRRFV
jgi:hypothetical protein